MPGTVGSSVSVSTRVLLLMVGFFSDPLVEDLRREVDPLAASLLTGSSFSSSNGSVDRGGEISP